MTRRGRALLRAAWGGVSSPHIAALSAWTALTATAWGVWLLMPWDTFASSSAYAAMAAYGPEWVWGLVFLAGGLAQCWAIRQRRYRQALATLMVGLWVFASAAFIQANWRGAPSVTYPLLALANVVTVLWLARREG